MKQQTQKNKNKSDKGQSTPPSTPKKKQNTKIPSQSQHHEGIIRNANQTLSKPSLIQSSLATQPPKQLVPPLPESIDLIQQKNLNLYMKQFMQIQQFQSIQKAKPLLQLIKSNPTAKQTRWVINKTFKLFKSSIPQAVLCSFQFFRQMIEISHYLITQTIQQMLLMPMVEIIQYRAYTSQQIDRGNSYFLSQCFRYQQDNKINHLIKIASTFFRMVHEAMYVWGNFYFIGSNWTKMYNKLVKSTGIKFPVYPQEFKFYSQARIELFRLTQEKNQRLLKGQYEEYRRMKRAVNQQEKKGIQHNSVQGNRHKQTKVQQQIKVNLQKSSVSYKSQTSIDKNKQFPQPKSPQIISLSTKKQSPSTIQQNKQNSKQLKKSSQLKQQKSKKSTSQVFKNNKQQKQQKSIKLLKKHNKKTLKYNDGKNKYDQSQQEEKSESQYSQQGQQNRSKFVKTGNYNQNQQHIQTNSSPKKIQNNQIDKKQKQQYNSKIIQLYKKMKPTKKSALSSKPFLQPNNNNKSSSPVQNPNSQQKQKQLQSIQQKQQKLNIFKNIDNLNNAIFLLDQIKEIPTISKSETGDKLQGFCGGKIKQENKKQYIKKVPRLDLKQVYYGGDRRDVGGTEEDSKRESNHKNLKSDSQQWHTFRGRNGDMINGSAKNIDTGNKNKKNQHHDDRQINISSEQQRFKHYQYPQQSSQQTNRNNYQTFRKIHDKQLKYQQQLKQQQLKSIMKQIMTRELNQLKNEIILGVRKQVELLKDDRRKSGEEGRVVQLEGRRQSDIKQPVSGRFGDSATQNAPNKAINNKQSTSLQPSSNSQKTSQRYQIRQNQLSPNPITTYIQPSLQAFQFIKKRHKKRLSSSNIKQRRLNEKEKQKKQVQTQKQKQNNNGMINMRDSRNDGQKIDNQKRKKCDLDKKLIEFGVNTDFNNVQQELGKLKERVMLLEEGSIIKQNNPKEQIMNDQIVGYMTPLNHRNNNFFRKYHNHSIINNSISNSNPKNLISTVEISSTRKRSNSKLSQRRSSFDSFVLNKATTHPNINQLQQCKTVLKQLYGGSNTLLYNAAIQSINKKRKSVFMFGDL